jgi:hypothetical protein
MHNYTKKLQKNLYQHCEIKVQLNPYTSIKRRRKKPIKNETAYCHCFVIYSKIIQLFINFKIILHFSNIAKSENAMLWRMFSRLETCIVYSCIWSVTLAKLIVPRKTWRQLWHSCISKLFLTKMQVKFSIFFHRGSLNVIGDKFRFVRSKLKSR